MHTPPASWPRGALCPAVTVAASLVRITKRAGGWTVSRASCWRWISWSSLPCTRGFTCWLSTRKDRSTRPYSSAASGRRISTCQSCFTPKTADSTTIPTSMSSFPAEGWISAAANEKRAGSLPVQRLRPSPCLSRSPADSAK